MDIAELKHQARALEQQGNLGGALETYRQILTEIDAIGGIRQELPVLIKIGDLYLKTGDVDQAIDSYERAAGEYATQGASQPVMSLCTKIIRADSQAVGAYLRLARRLLDSGYPDGAREVLIDYAQRGKLDRTKEGLERLAGRADDEVKRVLAKAIESAEERIPKRAPRPKAPPPPPPAAPPPPRAAPSALDLEQGLVSLEPKEPPAPPKRLTVPVGALDAEPTPSLLEQRPPEPRPPEAAPPQVMPELAFPTAEELQAVTPLAPIPPGDERFAPPRAPPAPQAPPAPPEVPLPPPPPPKLELETTLAPMEGMLSTAPPSAAPPPPPAEPSQPRLSVPMMEATFEPPPSAPPGQGPGEAWPQRRDRPSRPSHAIPEEPPLVSHPQPRASRSSARMASHEAYASPGTPRWVRNVLILLVLAGVVAVLIWRGVIPIDWLRNLLHKEEPVAVAPPPPPVPRPDTVMARDTATVVRRPAPRPEPAPPPVEEAPRRLLIPTLPPGVTLNRSVMMVSGLRVQSVSQIDEEGRSGISIVQLLTNGQRVILEEFPTDTVGAAGEIGVTGIPPDTVVGHVRMIDLEIRIKSVGIPEDRIVQFLQELVEVKP